MDRRDFLVSSTAAVYSALVTGSGTAFATPRSEVVAYWRIGGPTTKADVEPAPEITAAVDVLVPPDPEIPGDFKGSDFGADRVVASFLGELGQAVAVTYLDQYAHQLAGADFVDCTAEQQLEAIKQWIREREALEPMFDQVLSAVLTLSMVGAYEENSEAEQRVVFEAMGWFDPADPTGTFRIPNEGYPDAHVLPVALRGGLRHE